MAGQNDFLPFATAGGANTISQATYAALAARTAGFSTGTAQADQLNKVWRQSAFVAAAIGKLISDQNFNAVDDGNLANFISAFVQALFLNPGFTGNPLAPTQAGGDNSTRIATTAFIQNALAAYYTAAQIAANFGTISQVNTAQATANTANNVATNALNTAGSALATASAKGNPQTINTAQRWMKDNDTGVIRQWGSVTMTANFFTQGAAALQTFPIAYTSQIISIHVIPLSIWWVACGPDTISLNSFRPWCANSNGNQPYTGNFVWVSEGI